MLSNSLPLASQSDHSAPRRHCDAEERLSSTRATAEPDRRNYYLVHAAEDCLCDWKPTENELDILQRSLHITHVTDSARWMGKQNVKYTSQIRGIWRPSSNAAVSVEAASISGSEAADPPALELTEENLRRFESTRRTQRPTPSLLPMKAKARPVGPQPPLGPLPGWQDPVGDRPEETASRCQSEETSESGKRRSGEDVGSDCPDGNSGAENSTDSGPKNASYTNDETQSEKQTAHRRAKGGGGRGVSSKREREELFRSELASERQAGETAWEKELNRQAKEEEERRKAKALYRSEKMAQALEHGKEVQRRRQEEFEKGKQDLLQWRAEEEDRENLRKARRISFEQPAVPPTAGGVVLTPAPTARIHSCTRGSCR